MIMALKINYKHHLMLSEESVFALAFKTTFVFYGNGRFAKRYP